MVFSADIIKAEGHFVPGKDINTRPFPQLSFLYMSAEAEALQETEERRKMRRKKVGERVH